MKYYPLSDLERFDLLQAMFPGEFTDEHDLEDTEDLIWHKFEIDGENFDRLVGRLVMCAPVMGSPLTGKQHHVLGTVKVADGQQMITAAVKREVQDG